MKTREPEQSKQARSIETLRTARLTLRAAALGDAGFLIRLMNEPSWLEYIGDRHVYDLANATRYLEEKYFASYERFGFGFYIVELTSTSAPMGICGLIQRDTLPEVDLGFAFLPESWGHGYAFEASRAVLTHARDDLGINRIVAVTSPRNTSAARLLEKLGLKNEGTVPLTPGGPPLRLFAIGSQKIEKATGV